MVTIEKLKEFGANTEEGLARCYGSEALYIKLVNMIPKEGSFDALEQAVANQDLDKAFEAAHALKGVLGNLSLTPMYEKCSELTELLRAKKSVDYTPLVEELLNMRKKLCIICEE